jgi:hypothetical protein
MTSECLPRRALGLALFLAALSPALVARAQDPSTEPGDSVPSVRFQPRFIDAAEYRDGQVLLYDWPRLTRLVRWAAPVAQAVAEPDSTLSAELLGEFRARVTGLADEGPPAFMAGNADSIRAVLEGIAADLDRAESMLAETLPGEIAVPTGGERANVSDRDRTYATGPTAVRVPAGVGVGESDSLPAARLAGTTGEANYVDLIASALDRLDALVHLVRKLGESTPETPPTGDPGRAAPTPSPDRAPPRPGP